MAVERVFDRIRAPFALRLAAVRSQPSNRGSCRPQRSTSAPRGPLDQAGHAVLASAALAALRSPEGVAGVRVRRSQPRLFK